MLVLDSLQDASTFPQVGLDSSSRSFQEVYWKCVVCFFSTSVRLNPETRHILFTTAERLPIIKKIDLNRLFEILNVEVVRLPITHRIGTHLTKSWNNVFYILDILNFLRDKTDFDNVIIMDSDVIWVRPASEIFSDIKRRGALSMSIPYDAAEKLNGASRNDLIEVLTVLLGHRVTEPPHFSGGELFAATKEYIEKISELADEIWSKMKGLPPGSVNVYTEEHLFSLIYEILDLPIGTGDPHIRRMWTAIRLNNVTAEDVQSSRCAWHLPMEKKTGFADLFKATVDEESWFWTVEPHLLKPRLAHIMGIPKRTFRQWYLQCVTRSLYILNSALRKTKIVISKSIRQRLKL